MPTEKPRIMITVTSEVKDGIEQWAEDEGMSVSKLIVGVIEELLQEKGYLQRKSLLSSKKPKEKTKAHKT